MGGIAMDYMKDIREISDEQAVILWQASRLSLSGKYEKAPEILSVKTRVRDNILKSKEQKNIQPTKGGHKMVTCQNYVSLFYRQITSCPSDGGIS